MKLFSTKVLLALAITALPLSAKDAPSAAERLIEAMNYEATVLQSSEAMFTPLLDQFKAQGLPPVAIKEARAAFMDYMSKSLLDPKVKEAMVKLYQERFTEDELLQLISFYQSPIGQKTLTELPAIMGEGSKIGMEAAQKHIGEYQAKITGIVEKYTAAPEADDKSE